MTKVEDLIAAGYKQVSRKYRILARLPENKSSLELIKEVDPQLYKNIEEGWADHYRRVYSKDKVELTPEEFEEFTARTKGPSAGLQKKPLLSGESLECGVSKRIRESPQGFWTTKDYRVLKISEMDDSHLQNAIAMLERGGVKTARKDREAQEAFLSCPPPRGEMAQYAYEGEMMDVFSKRPYAEWVVKKYEELIAEQVRRAHK